MIDADRPTRGALTRIALIVLLAGACAASTAWAQPPSTARRATLKFDTKGVEFRPWVKRFIAAVRHNWKVPTDQLMQSGQVVVTFKVAKNGAISDIALLRRARVESFNTYATSALKMTDPADPLPPKYPSEYAFFTVTFFYNGADHAGSH